VNGDLNEVWDGPAWTCVAWVPLVAKGVSSPKSSDSWSELDTRGWKVASERRRAYPTCCARAARSAAST
jgi:hypothetical protein